MINLIRKLFYMAEDKKLPTPYIEKERHPCPFYGFSGMSKLMFDTGKNQCALITDSYSTCQMEVQQQEPNWYKCHMNNLDTLSDEEFNSLKEQYKNIIVFPEEFHPPDTESWDGISLKDWMAYVLKIETFVE